MKNTSQKVIKELFDRNLIKTNESIILVDGLEDAIFGVSSTIPKRIIYDYWVCIDILLNKYNMTFDEAQDTIDEFIKVTNEAKDDKVPLFVKPLNSKFNS